jgi:hypothetical protein
MLGVGGSQFPRLNYKRNKAGGKSEKKNRILKPAPKRVNPHVIRKLIG